MLSFDILATISDLSAFNLLLLVRIKRLQHYKMEDQYVVLLERVVAENVRLREAMEVRDAEQQRLLKELSLKIETNQPVAVAKTSRKRQRKVSVPQQCRKDFRKMYKAFKGSESFEGFLLDESFTAEGNQNATKTVIEAVIADHGGTDNCPWSMAELKGAAATYFRSLYDTSMRAKRGKLAAHNTLCRRQGRMRDKIQRTVSTLRAMPWSAEKKQTIEKAIARVEFTSSDESDLSEDENGKTRVRGFLVKKLSWERSALSNVKKTLDDAYIRGLHRRARFNLLVRRVHSLPSTRRRPISHEGLEWAVRPPATPSPSTGPSVATPSPSTRTIPSSTIRTTPSPGSRTSQTTPSSSSRTSQLTPSPSTGTSLATPSPSPGTSLATPSPGSRTSQATSTSSSRTSQATPSSSSRTSQATPSPSTGTSQATPTPSTRPSPSPSTRPLAEKSAPGIRRSLLTPSLKPTCRSSPLPKKKSKKLRKNTASKSRSPVY